MEDGYESELLELLRRDEGARRFLKHLIRQKRGETTEELKNPSTSSIIALEKFGIFEIVDHRHVLRDDVDISGLEALLKAASSQNEKQGSGKKLSGTPFLKREWLEKWEQVIANNQALDYFSAQIAPKVIHAERAKRAILIALASVEDQFSDRGRCHVLLIGPPGTAKSALGDYLSYALNIQSASLRTTKVGLTGYAAGSEIVPGALPQADGEAIFIDELDKIKREDTQGLLDAMSSGSIVIRVGRIHARLNARVRVIAAANTMDKFPPELIDRFDVIVKLEDYSEEEEKEIVARIIQKWFCEKEGMYGEELRSYLQWNRTFVPTISDEMRERMTRVLALYIDLDENIRGSMRKKESIIRIAFTIAKLNRRELQLSDLLEAIKLKNPEFNGGKMRLLKEIGSR